MHFLKGTKIYSIVKGSCPVCHTESMYEEPNPYTFGQTLSMHERCSHCNTKYKIEPFFFFGALYVSYPVGIVFATTAFLISYFILGFSPLTSFFILTATMIGFLPIILRLSRNIWINLFMHYNKSKSL